MCVSTVRVSTPGAYPHTRSSKESRFYPYAEVIAETQRRARHLVARGFNKGDRVALILPDPEEFVFTFFATLALILVSRAYLWWRG